MSFVHPDCFRIEPRDYSYVIQSLREFFLKKGYCEMYSGNCPSFMTISGNVQNTTSFLLQGSIFPLPQTYQLILETEIMKDDTLPGIFCIFSSYRDEETLIEGRHERIFPTLEFSTRGTLEDLIRIYRELLAHLSFENPDQIPQHSYDVMCIKLKDKVIGPSQEARIAEIHPEYIVTHYSEDTFPMWDICRDKVSSTVKNAILLLDGQKVISGAEKSCSSKDMQQAFIYHRKGKYITDLHRLYGSQRVNDELEMYLQNPFVPRISASIGISRLIRSMSFRELIKRQTTLAFSPYNLSYHPPESQSSSPSLSSSETWSDSEEDEESSDDHDDKAEGADEVLFNLSFSSSDENIDDDEDDEDEFETETMDDEGEEKESETESETESGTESETESEAEAEAETESETESVEYDFADCIRDRAMQFRKRYEEKFDRKIQGILKGQITPSMIKSIIKARQEHQQRMKTKVDAYVQEKTQSESIRKQKASLPVSSPNISRDNEPSEGK